MKISASNIRTNAGGWIPEGQYRARCIGTKAVDRNSSGNPMVTMDCEVIEPEMLEINGKSVTVAGRKFQLYLILNPERTGWASAEQVIRFCDHLDIELGEDEAGEPEFDTALHKEYFHGMEFDITLHAEEQKKVYAADGVGADGKAHKRGDAILDGDGKEISLGYRIAANPDDVGENCHPKKNEEIASQPY